MPNSQFSEFKKMEEILEIVSQIVHRIVKQKATLMVAESATGGLVQYFLTQLSGSSEFYKGGIVAYSNELKQRLLQVPESTITGEEEHRTVRQHEFRAQGRRKSPAEGTGSADETLARFIQVDHAAGPHTGMSGFRHQERVGWHQFAQLFAQPFWTNGNGVGIHQWSELLSPLADHCLRSLYPLLPQRCG